jgi:diadenosine tetraphosphate (Ap4A) HIT family hydrolase
VQTTRFHLPAYEACSFCQDLAGERECAFVIQNDHAAVEVDERQYERGTMLVIPRQHRESILEIEDAEQRACFRTTAR